MICHALREKMRLSSPLAVSLLFLVTVSLTAASLETVYQKIYTEISGIVPCFRLTNATSQIGCSATPHNVSGRVWFIETQSSLDYLISTYHDYKPYIVVLEPELFTSSNVLRLYNSDVVNGIIIRYIQENATIPPDVLNFSPAKPCPNNGFGSSQCRNWNNGTSLNFANFDKFAIFAITSNESYNSLYECYRENNLPLNGVPFYDNSPADYPLCTAELMADMQSVRSTPECFQRGRIWTNLGVSPCDPLGDMNVWGTLFELKQEQSVIMIATKLDSSAFFPYLAYGANNEMAGIVTLLTIAKLLGDMKRNGSLVNTTDAIMFTFFQGESYDYIGSSRMVYDMMNNEFPYSYDSSKQQPPRFGLSKIKAFIELSQVGIQTERETTSPVYYLHHNNQQSLVSALQDGSDDYNVSFQSSSAGLPLPPASAQMFLRENESVPVVIVTDFDQQYNNKFFGSRYDILDNLIGPDSTLDSSHPLVLQLANLAGSIAQTVLTLSGPNPSTASPPEADTELIVQLLHCFLQNSDCDFFKGLFSSNVEDVLLPKPMYRYVTVNTVTNTETYVAYQLLSNFTGENMPYVTGCGSNCTTPDNVETYYLLNQSNCACTKSYTHMHTATSPAFIDGNYSSDYYSTWAESRWTSTGMRIYVVNSYFVEMWILIAGILLTGILIVVSFQCYRKAINIFAVSASSLNGKTIHPVN